MQKKLPHIYLLLPKQQAKKSKLKPEKRQDRLDKDGEAGEVSSIMSSVQSFNIMV